MKGKILVTGGTGFIGSHTVVELIEAGYTPVILDSLENSYRSVLDGIEKITSQRPVFYQADLRDPKQAESVFQQEKDIQAVIHFAAYKAVGESIKKPLAYYENNVGGLLNLLRAMLAHGVETMVFSSSCAVYGDSKILPVTESMPMQMPTSPYGNTKKVCEEIISDVQRVSGLRSINLRYFNPVGAHPSAEIGELPVGVPNNLIPYITQTAAGIREKLTVFGNDYPTPDGTCVRDYIHVVDLAKAHVIALDRLMDGKNKAPIEIFNLGNGSGFTVLKVIQAFEKASGVKLNYQVGPRREGDVAAVYADTTLAREDLGWQPYETLDTMMSSAWKWQRHLDETKVGSEA